MERYCNEREMHYCGTPALGYILDFIIVIRRAFIANVSMWEDGTINTDRFVLPV